MTSLINLRTILIFLIIIIIFFIFLKCGIDENFTITESESESKSEKIPTSLDDIIGKKIHFYVTLNGLEYVACALPKTSFKNYDSTDCATTPIVLIATSDYTQLQNNEKIFIEEEQQICQFKNNLKSKHVVSEGVQETKSESESLKISTDCKIMPIDNALFNIYKIASDPKKPTDIVSYKILGRVRHSITKINTKSFSTDNANSGSNSSSNSSNSNTMSLCMQGAPKTSGTAKNDAWSEVEIIEIPNQTDKNIKLILKIEYPHKIKNSITYDVKTGKPVIISNYVGVCQKTYTINNSKITAKRLCLYDTQTDPNVIMFSPRII